MRAVSERTVQRNWEKAQIRLHRNLRESTLLCSTRSRAQSRPDRREDVLSLDEALAMPPEERTGWLASLRESNQELASLVEALLVEHSLLEEEALCRTIPCSAARAGAG